MRTIAVSAVVSLVLALGSAGCCVSTGPCAIGGNGLGACSPCKSDSDCAKLTNAPHCSGGLCLQCTADADCAARDAGTPFCDQSDDLCVQCTQPSQCPTSAPGCTLDCGGVCGSCEFASDCPSGMSCVVDAGACGSCH